jgi:hypothetical protein
MNPLMRERHAAPEPIPSPPARNPPPGPPTDPAGDPRSRPIEDPPLPPFEDPPVPIQDPLPERPKSSGVDPEDPVADASDDSFPASDPPSFTATHAGTPTLVRPEELPKDLPEEDRV